MSGIRKVGGSSEGSEKSNVQSQAAAFIRLLQQPESPTKFDQVQRFIENEPEAVIYALLDSPDYDHSTMSHDLGSLVGTSHGERYRGAAIEALQIGSPEQRARAFFILEGHHFRAFSDRISFPESVVEKALKDSNPLVRQRALDSLSAYHYGNPRDILPFALDALNDRSPAVRENAARIIWYLTNQSLPYDNPNSPVRLNEAFEIVHALQNRQAVEQDSRVRHQIAQALDNF